MYKVHILRPGGGSFNSYPVLKYGITMILIAILTKLFLMGVDCFLYIPDQARREAQSLGKLFPHISQYKIRLQRNL